MAADQSGFGFDQSSDALTGFYDPSKIGTYGNPQGDSLFPSGQPTQFNITHPQGGIDYSSATPGSGGQSGFDPNVNFGALQPFYSPGQPVDTSVTPAAATPTTPGAPAAAGTTPGAAVTPATGNWWDSILNGITGGGDLGKELGGMAPYLADYALAQKQADRAQAQNQKTIQPLYDQASKYLDAAGKELGLYESGTITPAQQILLDQNAAGQKASLAQYYASNGISDSSMMQQGMQQIDNSTVVMKQGFVDDSLKKALALEGAGMYPLMTAVQDKLISDTNLSQTMMQLMGTLAQAWAYQTANEGGSGGGGGGSAAASGGVGGGVGSLVNKGINYVKDKVSSLFGGGAAPVGADGASVLTDLGAPATSDLYGLSGIGSDLGLSGGGAAAAAGAPAAAGSGLLPGSIAGANMADTAAYAPSMIEATTPGAGAGSALSVAGTYALPAAVIAAAVFSQPYTIQRSYWNNLRTGITSGKSGNSTYDANTPAPEQQYKSKVALYKMVSQYGTGAMTHSIAGQGANRIPGDMMELAKSLGMVNADGTVNTAWNPGPDPFAARAAVQAQQGVKGGRIQ